MKLSLVVLTILLALAATACRGAASATPQMGAAAQAETPAAEVAQAGTPQAGAPPSAQAPQSPLPAPSTTTPVPPPTPTSAPTATSMLPPTAALPATPTPAPSATPRPKPKPTQPAQPVEPTATLAPSTTLTSTLETMAPLTLLAPPDGETFAGVSSFITFSWSAASRPLADDEYYVLVITHRQGKDFVWTKVPTFRAGEDHRWWADFGPPLHWQVVIARQRTGTPGEDPTGAEVCPYSETRVVYWNK